MTPPAQAKRKVIVPEGMRLAAGAATKEVDPLGYLIYPALEAALQWLADHPIVPTDAQWEELSASAPLNSRNMSYKWVVAEWQRRMFLVPEPPNGVEDLLWGQGHWGVSHNHLILEAFRRGQQSAKAKTEYHPATPATPPTASTAPLRVFVRLTRYSPQTVHVLYVSHPDWVGVWDAETGVVRFYASPSLSYEICTLPVPDSLHGTMTVEFDVIPKPKEPTR